MVTLEEAKKQLLEDVEGFYQAWLAGRAANPKHYPAGLESHEEWLEQFLAHLSLSE